MCCRKHEAAYSVSTVCFQSTLPINQTGKRAVFKDKVMLHSAWDEVFRLTHNRQASLWCVYVTQLQLQTPRPPFSALHSGSEVGKAQFHQFRLDQRITACESLFKSLQYCYAERYNNSAVIRRPISSNDTCCWFAAGGFIKLVCTMEQN